MEGRQADPVTRARNCGNGVHGVCREKTPPLFWHRYPQENTQACFARLWKKVRHPHHGAVLSHIQNGRWRLPRPRPNPAAGGPAEWLRPGIGLRYPSRVCSSTGDAIDRIVEAIDQLANDARGEISGRELAARVADLWLMVSALDPELARRSQGYTTSADGVPGC